MPNLPETDPTLEGILRILASGPASAPDVCKRLGISQPLFSRSVRGSPRILATGRARATRYAARRSIEGVALPIPVYSVRPAGESPRHLLNLHPVKPEGFWLEPVSPTGGGKAGFTEDLPWFLSSFRPAGWLGRLVPREYPALDAPRDVLLWSADHVLRFATCNGWNMPGALIVGEEAFRTFVEHASSPPDRLAIADRARAYPTRAANVLATGPAGSSAGGEQPKFLVTLDDGHTLVPVLVKFSPPLEDEKSVRTADLLVAEHVAHGILAGAGHPTARSTLLRADNRLFLEIERFDREGPEHRRGVVLLEAVDGEFVGSRLDRWSSTTSALVALGLLGEADHREVRWLSVFGDLVANTDMHASNLALWLDDLTISGVAPCYDMLPMQYAVRQNELVPVDFSPRVPLPSDADVARSAWEVAVRFWQTLAAHAQVSKGFRAIAEQNARKVAGLADALARLPV